MNNPTINGATGWRKTARCEAGACVEVAPLPDGVGLRNSTLPDTYLRIQPAAWTQFITTIKGGFDV